MGKPPIVLSSSQCGVTPPRMGSYSTFFATCAKTWGQRHPAKRLNIVIGSRVWWYQTIVDGAFFWLSLYSPIFSRDKTLNNMSRVSESMLQDLYFKTFPTESLKRRGGYVSLAHTTSRKHRTDNIPLSVSTKSKALELPWYRGSAYPKELRYRILPSISLCSKLRLKFSRCSILHFCNA